jgi:hypothetical protein
VCVGIFGVNGFGKRLYNVNALEQVPVVWNFHTDVEDIAADYRAEVVQQEATLVQQLKDDEKDYGSVGSEGSEERTPVKAGAEANYEY